MSVDERQIELADAESSPRLKFRAGGIIMESLPVAFQKFDETAAITTKSRRHQKMASSSLSLEFEKTLPYGSEPVICRSAGFFANRALVTTDVKVRGGVTSDRLSVDSLLLTSKFTRAGIIRWPREGAAAAMEWTDIAGRDAVVFEDSRPFLVCLLETDSGSRIEIGTGDDLWRWIFTERLGLEGTRASFKVSHIGGQVRIDRDVLLREGEGDFAFPSANRRFKWYFAWDSGAVKAVDAEARAAAMENGRIDLSREGAADISGLLPDRASNIRLKGTASDAPCFHSDALVNALKRSVRSLENPAGRKAALMFAGPHLCDNAAHVERAGKVELPHWDAMAAFDFHEWASNHLGKAGAGISMRIRKDSVFAGLPSFAGMF